MSSYSSGSLRGGGRRRFKSEINVVPYIDVMLVLLIIFMVTAPLTTPNTIDLPTAGKSKQVPIGYIQVNLKTDGPATIGINGQKDKNNSETVNGHDELDARLRELHADNQDLPVVIYASKDIRYDEVVRVIAQSQKLGISRVSLATKQ